MFWRQVGVTGKPSAVLLIAAWLLCLSACSTAAKANPQTLLQQAKAKLDSSSAAHFVLTSSNVSASGTQILNGSGDLVRPDGMQGTFGVTVGGFTANVKVVSEGGVFEALLPFQPHFQKTDPANYGLTDPAQLMNTQTGLTRLLAIAQDPKLTKSERVAGELLDTVTYTVPGSDIPVLPDAKPSVPVVLVAAIDPRNHEVRQISLTGPLTSATSNSTYVLTLTDYNEQVTITVPPTS